MKNKIKIIIAVSLSIVLAAIISFFIYTLSFSKTPNVSSLSIEENYALMEIIKKNYSKPVMFYPEFETSNLENKIKLKARSCILLDATTGAIIYEKNADELIPPASMTKLVVMYILFSEIEKGNIQLTDIVSLPPESWYINALPGSSLMFLEQDDKVTLYDLMLGMSVMSGNDAAVACAYYVSDSIENFVQRMNKEMEKLNLVHTRFVDTSGYSELNQTTAREFAKFTRIYLQTFPQSLELFHNKKEMTFKGTLFKSTNKVLGKVLGVDGLKTGFIPESGFNYAMTCKQNSTRIIAIFMGGPGYNSIEGNINRIEDAINLTENFFANYETTLPEYYSYNVNVFTGKKNSLTLIPAFSDKITTPVLNQPFRIEKNIPQFLNAPITAGEKIGNLKYYINDILIQTVPLIADRNIEKGNKAKIFIDKCARKIFKILFTSY
ncbi:MAG: D-alanyl-D-alanine carboxypeptidase [Treponema sp.]|nr:D-alanyl-D-alanine carboxypeptidase [Treponema sp.]